MCFGHSKECLIETVLLSTHNICFGREIREIIFQYALLSGGLLVGKDLTVLTERIELIPSRLISYDPSTNATVELVSGIAFVFWAYFYAFLLSADFFFKIISFKNNLSEILSVLNSLDQDQTKGYQQTTLVVKELTVLTIKAPITTAAEDKFCNNFLHFLKKK